MNKVTLELTVDHLNVVLFALSKLPLETSLEAFNAVRQQADGQLKKPEGPLSNKVIK